MTPTRIRRRTEECGGVRRSAEEKEKEEEEVE
jgi:hypothetical protein